MPDHDCEPADEALQRSVSHFHEQTGPSGLQPCQGTAANEVLSLGRSEGVRICMINFISRTVNSGSLSFILTFPPPPPFSKIY